MILVDTHVVVWLAGDAKRLSPRAVASIRDARDRGHGLAIASVTLYELAWLVIRGKIQVSTSPEAFLLEVESRFVIKPLTASIASRAIALPSAYPKDPMDRIIGATALVEGLKLVTADSSIRNSKAVHTVW